MSGILGGLIGSFATVSTGSYESIATQNVSSSVASITFSSIPSTYKHLQIRSISSGSYNCAVLLRFNGDTSSSYAYHSLTSGPGYGTSVYTNNGSSSSSMLFFDQQLGGSTYQNNTICDILDYANTNKYKTNRTLSGVNNSANGGFIYFNSGLWQSTSAVTSINLFPASFTFNAGSKFALYGIKG